jgi:hypothetical protein
VGLTTVARILKNVITNVFTYQITFEDAVQNLKNLIFLHSNVSRVMRELEFTATQLQQAIIQVQEGLETSATGR